MYRIVIDPAGFCVLQDLALDAVRCVAVPAQNGGQAEIDIKKYVKVEKIPGGSLDDCRVLAGVMFNKAPSPPLPPRPA